MPAAYPTDQATMAGMFFMRFTMCGRDPCANEGWRLGPQKGDSEMFFDVLCYSIRRADFGRRAAPPSGSLVGGCCWADSNSEVIGRGGSSMLTAVFRRVLVRVFLWLTNMFRVLLVHMQKLFVVYDTFTQFRSAIRTAGFL